MNLTASTLLNRLPIRGKFGHVQVLLKLAELGSVQRSAEAIGLTQSSVTQALAYIERLKRSSSLVTLEAFVRQRPAWRCCLSLTSA